MVKHMLVVDKAGTETMVQIPPHQVEIKITPQKHSVDALLLLFVLLFKEYKMPNIQILYTKTYLYIKQ